MWYCKAQIREADREGERKREPGVSKRERPGRRGKWLSSLFLYPSLSSFFSLPLAFFCSRSFPHTLASFISLSFPPLRFAVHSYVSGLALQMKERQRDQKNPKRTQDERSDLLQSSWPEIFFFFNLKRAGDLFLSILSILEAHSQSVITGRKTAKLSF